MILARLELATFALLERVILDSGWEIQYKNDTLTTASGMKLDLVGTVSRKGLHTTGSPVKENCT